MGASAAANAASRPAPEGSTRRLPGRSTPTRLRRMLVAIVATTIVSCFVATVLTVGRRDTVVSARDRTSQALLDALEARAVLSDADRAVWASFRSGEAELIGPGQDYQDDITTAGQDVETLAGLQATRGEASGQLQTLNGQLVNYQALVAQADATYRTASALPSPQTRGQALGYAYLTYASKALRAPQNGLLAGLEDLAASNRQRLRTQAGAPWTSPWLVLAYAAVALLALGSLLHAQGFLRRRFRRTISPALALATTLAVAISAWLGVVSVRADHAFSSAHDVALARLDAALLRQTRSVDADASALRAGLRRSVRTRDAAANAKAGRGLDIRTTRSARRQLDSHLAAAADTGGLFIAFPFVAAAIAGLAFFGLKRRLDEYRA